MSSGLGRHLADGEHQDRVSLLMPSSSKCNLFLPLGHHRRPNLRKGRGQRDKQKLLQRLLSGSIPLPVPTHHLQLLQYRVTPEGLLSRPTLGEGVFLIFLEDISSFQVPDRHRILWGDVLWRLEQPKTRSVHQHHLPCPVGKK